MDRFSVPKALGLCIAYFWVVGGDSGDLENRRPQQSTILFFQINKKTKQKKNSIKNNEGQNYTE